IVPIGNKNPAALEEVYVGAALRLQTCCDYYDCLLEALRTVVERESEGAAL
ncbi:iron-containing redox enzyme family protein, partial [Klebsiella michiganensis]